MNVNKVTHVEDAAGVAFETTSRTPRFCTVEQVSARNPAFTCPALRNLIFKAEARQSSAGEIPGNGLAEVGAIVRLGRRVLIDEAKFLAWVAQGGSQK